MKRLASSLRPSSSQRLAPEAPLKQPDFVTVLPAEGGGSEVRFEVKRMADLTEERREQLVEWMMARAAAARAHDASTTAARSVYIGVQERNTEPTPEPVG